MLKLARAPFWSASAAAVMLGAAAAMYYTGQFSFFYFILTNIGVIALHIASNITNDHYDYLTGADPVGPVKPFSGGSQMLQRGYISLEQSKWLFIIFFIIGIIFTLYFTVKIGIWALLFGVAGGVIGYLYTAPPVRFSYKGMGEFMVGLSFGPLTVLGSYYVQTGIIDWRVLYISLPISALIMAVLFINQYPDYDQDRAVGKMNILIRIGKKKGLFVYHILMISAYVLIVGGIVFKILPIKVLLSMFTIPLAITAMFIANKYWNDDKHLVFTNALTIICHFSVAILMTIGLII